MDSMSTDQDTVLRLKEQAKIIGARVDRGIVFLHGLRERVGQDSPEYDQYFAEWEKVNREYRRLDDLYFQQLEQSQAGGQRV